MLSYGNLIISYEDDKTLSKYVHNALAKFDFDESEEDISFEDEIENTISKEEQEQKENIDSNFQKIFYKRYFITQGELPIFHSELYAFITGAITPNFEKLDSEMDKALFNPETEEQASSLGAKFIKEITSDFLKSIQMIITTVSPINQTITNLLSKEQLSHISPSCIIIDTSGSNINPQWLAPQITLIQDNNLTRFIPHSASR